MLRGFIGLCLFLGAVGCSSPDEQAGEPRTPIETASPRRPNVFLVTVDTLRADHMSLHGYSRDTTPWLSAIGEQGAVFDHAYSPAAWTPPAMASIMTGGYPLQHGIDNGAEVGAKSFSLPTMPESHRTLAEYLRDAGYRTFAVTTNFHLDPKMGFAQGFDTYQALGMVDDARKAYEAVDGLADALRGPDPWFLWVHILDPHGPYFSNAPHAERFDRDLEGKFQGVAESRNERFASMRTQYVRSMEDDPNTQPGSIGLATLEVLYDSEVRFVDATLAKLSRRIPFDNNTLFVLTSDHGEEFREHGNLGHRRSLFQDQLHVPMVVAWPGHVVPRRVATAVSTVDLMPTIVALATGTAPTDPFVSGVDLSEALRIGEDPDPRILFAQLRVNQRAWWSVIEHPHKLVHDIDGGTEALYDVEADPGESKNRIDADPERQAKLAGAWARFQGEAPTIPSEAVKQYASKDEIERLRALGYVDESSGE